MISGMFPRRKADDAATAQAPDASVKTRENGVTILVQCQLSENVMAKVEELQQKHPSARVYFFKNPYNMKQVDKLSKPIPSSWYIMDVATPPVVKAAIQKRWDLNYGPQHPWLGKAPFGPGLYEVKLLFKPALAIGRHPGAHRDVLKAFVLQIKRLLIQWVDGDFNIDFSIGDEQTSWASQHARCIPTGTTCNGKITHFTSLIQRLRISSSRVWTSKS